MASTAAGFRTSPMPPACRRDRFTITSKARKPWRCRLWNGFGRTAPVGARCSATRASNRWSGCVGIFVRYQTRLFIMIFKEVRGRLAEIYAAWSRSIESCVREAEKADRVQPRLPAAVVATFLVNAWEGAVLRSKVEQDKSPLDQFERVVFASIFT